MLEGMIAGRYYNFSFGLAEPAFFLSPDVCYLTFKVLEVAVGYLVCMIEVGVDSWLKDSVLSLLWPGEALKLPLFFTTGSDCLVDTVFVSV